MVLMGKCIYDRNPQSKRRYNLDKKEVIYEIVNMYNKGIDRNTIAKKFNTGSHAIEKRLIENNIRIRNIKEASIINGKKRQIKIINKSLDKEKAYILGVILGDGHIQYNTGTRCYCVTLNSIDKEFVEFFNKCVLKHYGIKGKIIKIFPKNKNWKKQYIVKINSKALCENLINSFNHKHKTYDWEVPKEISETRDYKLIGIFLKGFFDSEGHVSVNEATNKRYSGNRIEIANVSKEGIYQIYKLMKYLGFNPSFKEKNKTKLPHHKKVYLIRLTNREQIIKFKEIIGFTIKRKQKILNCVYNLKPSKRYKKEEYYKAINLREKGFSIPQISDKLNLPITALNSWIYYNRKPLEVNYYGI